MKNRILQTLNKYWGYQSFRLFQEEVILSILENRDTVTILPTGGGKSVCFQLPALIAEGMAVVISPLISLMKDQVDYLKELRIPAECLNSSLTGAQQAAVLGKISAGRVRLLYLSPERLLMEHTIALLKGVKISFFVIDEAHCISHWGHDFREDYRHLKIIKKQFPQAGVHAFTATATAEVKRDIVAQLQLHTPEIYMGSVDRPNLTYRVFPRSGNLFGQIAEAIRKHPGEPGIIYCLKRTDVDEISKKLNEHGYMNCPYHAGLSDKERRNNQEEFSSERINLIVATIAFGMGVDRSNIRYVIHAAMPKSIEHYQQETGRAGRDGLPADCTLFYAGSDYRIWEYMLRDSPDKEVMLAKLSAMYGFCVRPECRHRYLSNYFAQEYGQPNCGACDYCLSEVETVEEPLIVGQKILSCVARVKERFGAAHIVEILKGNVTAAIEKWEHDKLSTFALMQGETKNYIRYMLEQLIGQGFLRREGEFMTIAITEAGWELLRGKAMPLLAKPLVAEKKKEIEAKRKSRRAEQWENVDEELFELLRTRRAELARGKGIPAYMIFSDKSLKEMAQRKPKTLAQFSNVSGVGTAKQEQYGAVFLDIINQYVSSGS
ncbi:MAG: DNA helicase RecQ [Syntrophales bacterium]